MIIRLNENRFNRIFLFESKNSKKAAERTKELIAAECNLPIDDEYVISTEQGFRDKYFGEGRDVDWFITLEPFAYKWLSTSGPFYSLLNILLGTIKSKAETSQNRMLFMQKVKSFQTFNEMRNFIGDIVKQDRIYARQNKVRPKTNPRYGKPLGPLSFEESNKYGKYSGVDAGNGGGCICYTTQTGQRYNYSNNEKNSLFLLLRDDWETVNTTHDGSEINNGLEGLNMHLNKKSYNNPEGEYYSGYDDYGLSMIFVWIDPNGNLAYCNTRWNHNANYAPGHGVDNALNEQDIEHLMGASFSEIFNVESFNNKADIAYEDLTAGKSKGIIFNSYEEIGDTRKYVVNFKGKYNIWDENEKKFLYPHDWFNSIEKINRYGDLIILYDDSSWYFDVDTFKLFDSYGSFLRNVISNRLSQGVDPNLFFERLEDNSTRLLKHGEYGVINKLGDLFITYHSNDKYRIDYFFNGKIMCGLNDYLECLSERVNSGYSIEDIFTEVQNSPLGYSLVKIIPAKDVLEKCWIFADGEIKNKEDFFGDGKIINKFGHSIISCCSITAEKIMGHETYGALFFDGSKFYEIDEYHKLVSKLVKNGGNIREIFSDVEINENVPNYAIVSLPYGIGRYYIEYSLFDLNAGDFVFDKWFKTGKFLDYSYFNEGNSLLNEVQWIMLEDDSDYDDENYAIPVINGKVYLYNNELPRFVWKNFIKVGPFYGFMVRFGGDYCNILGRMEDGSIDFVLKDVDISELPYDIQVPSDSNAYIVLQFEDESDKIMVSPWRIVTDEEFVQYINEELEDGEYLSAFGEWEDVNELFGIIKFADGGSNIIDKRNARLMLAKNVYGGIRADKGNNLRITSYCDNYRQNIMKEDGTLVINTENPCKWPQEIKLAGSDKKELYLVEIDDYQYNFIDGNGILLLKNNFSELTKFYNGICVGEGNDGRQYFIDENGKILNEKNPVSWFSSSDLKSPSFSIPIRCNLFSKDGTFYFSKTTHKFFRNNKE